MALMERVSTLVRANLNDLVDRAEDPEKMLKQVMLDMHNQLMQVKTQVAIALADEHVLARRRKEHEDKSADWVRKAELALGKGDEALARAALERSLTFRQMGDNFRQQAEDQAVQVENLKTALHKLEQKLSEAQSKSELLIAQHRRARAVERAVKAKLAVSDGSSQLALERMQNKVMLSEAGGHALAELATDDIGDRLAALERDDEVEKLLNELKSKRAG
ncbi:MAG: PspA/IM30 family protein [Acidobacteriota bacterium]|nr:PspA/IM30 family protein [Acidobacteriota bacterium]